MRDNRYIKASVLAALALALIATFASMGVTDAADKHPIEVEKAVCSMCHPDKWGENDHTVDWIQSHRFSAARSEQVCNLCHQRSFCADCHADKEEIKPSDKYRTSPLRSLPHRGDYITQHMIDGKINPAACFRCHGRQNNERCKVCHK
ncbi:MAG: hypothetical protein Kow0025_21840 [Thermodesulfovibrionales bacterium]